MNQIKQRLTSQRQKLIANNIANLSTPNYRPYDVTPQDFQATLREAIDHRRGATDSLQGRLNLPTHGEIQFNKQDLTLNPQPLDENVLFHDRNNRDLDRQMQSLAENTLMHSTAVDLLKNQFDVLRLAIRGRM